MFPRHNPASACEPRNRNNHQDKYFSRVHRIMYLRLQLFTENNNLTTEFLSTTIRKAGPPRKRKNLYEARVYF